MYNLLWSQRDWSLLGMVLSVVHKFTCTNLYFGLVRIYVCLFVRREQPQRMDNILPSSLNLVNTPSSVQQVYSHLSPNRAIEDDVQRSDHYGAPIDVNLSPWAELYPTG